MAIGKQRLQEDSHRSQDQNLVSLWRGSQGHHEALRLVSYMQAESRSIIG